MSQRFSSFAVIRAIMRLFSRRQEIIERDREIERLAQELRRSREEALTLARVLRESKVQHDKVVAELQETAATDPLTGLWNRRGGAELLNRLLGALARQDQGAPGHILNQPTIHSIALIAFDVNDFKQVNDRHGHAAGDQALVVIAELLKEVVPSLTRGHRTTRRRRIHRLACRHESG